MYRFIAQHTKNFSSLHLRNLGSLSAQKTTTVSAPTTASNTEKWDLCASVLVERVPVVSKTLNAVEREFQELLWRIEFENSLKSDHELQYERDLLQAELLKTGKIEIDADESGKLTAQDKEDAFIEELKKFTPVPRLTQDDEKNNLTSTNRCLEDTLYLLVEQQLGNKKHLLLPQGVRLEGETMRQTAERVLHEICGTELRVQFHGNAPCGFYKYKYPVGQRVNSIGAKMFFYRATLQQGNVQPKAKFEWSLKSAFDRKLPNNYKESIEKFLF